MSNVSLSTLPAVMAAIEWNNAGVSLLKHNDSLDSAVSALQQGLSTVEQTLRTLESQPNRALLSTPLSVVTEPISMAHQQKLEASRFVYSHAFKILTIENVQQLETAAACIIFNISLAKQIAGFQSQDASILLAAQQLYDLVTSVTMPNPDPQQQQDSTRLLLSVVALNNRGAALSTLGQVAAAQQMYGNLLPLLSLLERFDTKLIAAAYDAIADNAISSVYQIDMKAVAAAAA